MFCILLENLSASDQMIYVSKSHNVEVVVTELALTHISHHASEMNNYATFPHNCNKNDKYL